VKLTDLIPKKAIILDLKAKDKKSAIHELVQAARKAHENEKFNVTDIVDAIVAREKTGSTGIGDGVGIPHAKVEGVKDVIGAFGRIQPGLDFTAVDGQPVQLIFLILAPPSQNDAYLQMLRKVMGALKKPNFTKFLKSVKAVKDIEEVFRELEEPAPV
jgi:mannitol/fructose-specific phosphotransferase system IIA component (Ntr-type)